MNARPSTFVITGLPRGGTTCPSAVLHNFQASARFRIRGVFGCASTESEAEARRFGYAALGSRLAPYRVPVSLKAGRQLA